MSHKSFLTLHPVSTHNDLNLHPSKFFSMCIYLGNQSGLTYNSGEHVIPAGLGGIQKLPDHFVSRQFNTGISNLERGFMRTSILSFPRQILGPGKRGSLNAAKATKSQVIVHQNKSDADLFSLGFVKLGIPYDIPNVFYNTQTGVINVSWDKRSTKADIDFFKQSLLHYDTARIKLIQASELSVNQFLIGFSKTVEDNFTCFIAANDVTTHPFNQSLLEAFHQNLLSNQTLAKHVTHLVRSHGSFLVDNDYFRVCAKIAFNTMAFLKGENFVSDASFDPIRNYIAWDGDNQFVNFAPGLSQQIGHLFPEDAHYAFISSHGSNLIANVCLYNHLHHPVILSRNFKGNFNLDGLICDWKNRRELSFHKGMLETITKAMQQEVF